MSNLKKEHDDLTKAYYVDKSISKEEFDRAHTINGLKKQKEKKVKDKYDLSDEEIDARLAELQV